jgi:hypothetical protein
MGGQSVGNVEGMKKTLETDRERKEPVTCSALLKSARDPVPGRRPRRFGQGRAAPPRRARPRSPRSGRRQWPVRPGPAAKGWRVADGPAALQSTKSMPTGCRPSARGSGPVTPTLLTTRPAGPARHRRALRPSRHGMAARPGPTRGSESRSLGCGSTTSRSSLRLCSSRPQPIIVQRSPSRDRGFWVHYKLVASPPGSAVTNGDHKL